MWSDLRVAPRSSFQSIPLTVMVTSPTGELLLRIVTEYTVLTFKSGGGVEMDKEQLHAISWLVITISHQSDQLREVEVKSWSLYQWSNRLKCVPGMLLDRWCSPQHSDQLVLTVFLGVGFVKIW